MELETAEAVAEYAEETVAVVFLVEVVVQTEAHVRCRRAESVARLCAFPPAVADTQLCYGEEFVEEINAGCNFHVGVLGISGFHDEADEVCADSHSVEHGVLFFLLLRLLGVQRKANHAEQ